MITNIIQPKVIDFYIPEMVYRKQEGLASLMNGYTFGKLRDLRFCVKVSAENCLERSNAKLFDNVVAGAQGL